MKKDRKAIRQEKEGCRERVKSKRVKWDENVYNIRKVKADVKRNLCKKVKLNRCRNGTIRERERGESIL